MIHHLVVWRFREEEKGHLDEALALLRGMKDTVPGIVSLHAGRDFLHSGRSFDLGLSVSLATRDDLQAYDAHPSHQPVKAFIGPKVLQSVAVDFED